MSDRLSALANAGVSIWLDDLSRERIESGGLADLVANSSVVGVTTNPTIFAAALADGDRYADQVAELKAKDASIDASVEALTTDDVRHACDLLRDVYDRTDGVDGRVSIEVEPALAHDTHGTVVTAKRLWETVDRPNLLIKIPATLAGLPAITQTVAAGISVNVTLIFSLDRYRGVMDAYLSGLEQAAEAGVDVSTIHSVASFFVSRVDAEVDTRLADLGRDDLQGRAAVANARLAFELYEEVFSSERFTALRERGGNVQRPLWASTGVKNPEYSDTMYVTDLVTDGVVNTMPEATLTAFADHGQITGDTVRPFFDDARTVINSLADAGVSYDDVVGRLEVEGLEKFEASWTELVATVEGQLELA